MPLQYNLGKTAYKTEKIIMWSSKVNSLSEALGVVKSAVEEARKARISGEASVAKTSLGRIKGDLSTRYFFCVL